MNDDTAVFETVVGTVEEVGWELNGISDFAIRSGDNDSD